MAAVLGSQIAAALTDAPAVEDAASADGEECIGHTPAWYANMGGSFMSLDELNQKRHRLPS